MKQYLLKYFVLWLGICLATACSEEELPESREGWCNVSLQVTTGAVETKAYGGDTYANAHEFIHSLCLFVVNEQGQIEKKIYPQDLATTHPEAAEGNLLNWSSPNFEIPEGTKTIYAFANWETAGSEAWNNIIAKTDQDQLTEDDLKIAVDLNEKIDLTSETDKKFIPMSGKTTVTLAANANRNIPITLTRLVSRVEVRLTNKHTDALKMSAESMGNFANEVTLFKDLGSVSGRTTTLTRNSMPPSIATNNDNSWIFYVNETNGSDQFHIKMELNDKDYDTPTVRTNLPRNSVYHLVFTYSEYQLTLKAKAQIAPIGVLPIEVYPERSLTNEYMLELPEGCTFSIKPSITKNNASIDGVTWEWRNNSPSLVQCQETGGDIFNGYLTAQIGQDATLTLKPTSTASGEESLPVYTITIRPVALPDLPSASLFGLSPWGSRLRSAECFNLIVNGKEDKQ